MAVTGAAGSMQLAMAEAGLHVVAASSTAGLTHAVRAATSARCLIPPGAVSAVAAAFETPDHFISNYMANLASCLAAASSSSAGRR